MAYQSIPDYGRFIQGIYKGTPIASMGSEKQLAKHYQNFVSTLNQAKQANNPAEYQRLIDVHGIPGDPFQQQQDAMAAAEAARMANIDAAINAINKLFGSRAGIYDKYRDATFKLNRDALNEGYTDARQQLGFALARAGQSGGSTDTDKHSDLLNQLNKGILQAQNYADDAAMGLRAQDDSMRSMLMGLASTGSVSPGQISSGVNFSTPAPVYAPELSQVFNGISDNVGRALYALGYGGSPFADQDETAYSAPSRTYSGRGY